MNKRYATEEMPLGVRAARQNVASQVRNARISLRLTQQTLADMTGTKKSNISRMESGRYNPSLDFLVKIADSLGKELTVRIS